MNDLDCAICFEPAARCTLLPCTCNVTYCTRCWDRALAQSFNACGEARCPTCRCPVCVDFDTDKACLVFSRETLPLAADLDCAGNGAARIIAERRNRAQAKLRTQARPVQVRILRQFGEERPALQEFVSAPEAKLREMSVAELRQHVAGLNAPVVDRSEKEELVQVLMRAVAESSTRPIVLGSLLAAANDVAPSCVCGSRLQRVSGQERTWRCSEEIAGGHPPGSPYFDTIYRRLTAEGHSVCFCDLCETNVPSTCAVWTCEQGDATILHATSYDVCDVCFLRYVTGFGDSARLNVEQSYGG